MFFEKTFAEFFAGIGLMRIGLEQEGWKAVFANDIAQDKFQMYSDHFGENDGHFLVGDIHELDAEQVPTVGMATASFPCNDLSLAGMRKGLGGKQSSAYWGFVRILDQMGDRRPPIVLLENVAGFLSSHGGRDFQAALESLNKLGYAVDAFIIDAARFVPQSRVRLFVIGHLCSGDWQLRESLAFYESPVRPKALAQFIFGHPEIIWGLRDLPPPPDGAPSLSEILEDLPDDSPYWWTKERSDYLVGQMSERHYEQLRRMMGQQQWSWGTVFRRIRKGRSMGELRTDGIAGCLRTPRGGSGRQILVQAGYGTVKARLLTPRECARLMGADRFVVKVPLNQALFGFGDAVCVPVVAWIARHYLNPLFESLSRPSDMISSGHRETLANADYAIASNI
ncbi:MAG: (cytosine-5)-methyltransferase 1 [Thermodesulfobacteriota bacterium]|nr:(cytosine-5)-methyltransferase 1 [Thermodesulfobacteriota bacterium]